MRYFKVDSGKLHLPEDLNRNNGYTLFFQDTTPFRISFKLEVLEANPNPPAGDPNFTVDGYQPQNIVPNVMYDIEPNQQLKIDTAGGAFRIYYETMKLVKMTIKDSTNKEF